MTSTKREELDAFVRTHSDLPKQGTDEWLELRRSCIGGSELSVITGDNKYSSINQLIASKAGSSSFTGNIATRWGKVFELVTINLCETVMDIDGIHELSSIPSELPYLRYSPDGLAVGKVDDKQQIILFEFKSPFCRIPDGNIPKHYVPQVNMGLWTCKLADVALFVNNMYRKCKFSDLDDSATYDIAFHTRDTGALQDDTKALAAGVLLFYQTTAQRDECSLSSVSTVDLYAIACKNESNPKKQTLMDFGKSSSRLIDQLLKLYDGGLISMMQSEPYVFPAMYEHAAFKHVGVTRPNDVPSVKSFKKSCMQQFKGVAKKNTCLGLLSWKLLRSDMIIVPQDRERYDAYIGNYVDKIVEVLSIARQRRKDCTKPVYSSSDDEDISEPESLQQFDETRLRRVQQMLNKTMQYSDSE